MFVLQHLKQHNLRTQMYFRPSLSPLDWRETTTGNTSVSAGYKHRIRNNLFFVSAQGTRVESRGVPTEESEEAAKVNEKVAELASEEGMGARYHGGSKKEADEKSDEGPRAEDDVEGEIFFEVESGAMVTSEGTSWAFKPWGIHLMLPPDAVSERTSIVVRKWKYRVRSPPLQEHEAITSNVIELSFMNVPDLKFNNKAKLSLSHSATDLRGYELVIKKLIDKETNNWEDMDGTKSIRCRQDFEDNLPSHMKILDFLFPVAQADISECSTYAVVSRLKTSPTYTITSCGGSLSHPDFPGVMIAIPENAVAPNSKLSVELKVQEVLNEDFEEDGKFLGPVLRIKCVEAVQFLKPVTIQLPISLREQEDMNLNPTTCHVRVLFLKSDNGQKEWIDITDDLVNPPSLDRRFVRFHVKRFSGYSTYVERRDEHSRFYVQRIINFLNSRIFGQPRLTVFFAYFRPDLMNILCLICCPAQIKGEVVKKLENQGIMPICNNSKKDMTPGHDEASVSVSGGIYPYIKSDMEEMYLRVLENDPDDAELEVCFRYGRNIARVEFFRKPQEPLCKLHLRTPARGTDRSDLSELTRQSSAVMEGNPTESVLERLSNKIRSKDWRKLGRRLTFHEAQLDEFDNDNEQISEKAYAMLLAWKQNFGKDATYSVLKKALCDTTVGLRDLAREFCCY